jgi:hypothetical protein
VAYFFGHSYAYSKFWIHLVHKPTYNQNPVIASYKPTITRLYNQLITGETTTTSKPHRFQCRFDATIVQGTFSQRLESCVSAERPILEPDTGRPGEKPEMLGNADFMLISW